MLFPRNMYILRRDPTPASWRVFLPFVAHDPAPKFGPILYLSNLSSFWGAAQCSVVQVRRKVCGETDTSKPSGSA